MELVKTTAEQRAEIYEDVRMLLMPGFLTQSIKIGSLRLALRTLDTQDYYLLRARSFGLNERDQLSWALAQTVWMVNGSIVRDENSLYDLSEAIGKLPLIARDALNRLYLRLMDRMAEATKRIEGFLFEDESRVLWRQYGAAIRQKQHFLPHQRLHNSIINLWVYYNTLEDTRIEHEQEWSLVKFQLAPHAPKGAKKISTQDRKREVELQKERQRILDRVFYQARGLLDEDTPEEKAARARYESELIMAETEEELRESMRRWVSGIKDDHDKVVDNVKARIKHGVETRKRERDKNRAALDQALEEEGYSRNQLAPLAGDAGRKFLERMRTKFPGASTVVDDNTHNSAYKKYIEKNPEVGDLHVDEEGNIISLSPVNPDMLEMLKRPDDGAGPSTEAMSLQEQISRRRPTIDDGEDA